MKKIIAPLKLASALAAVVAFTGCVSMDRISASNFEPIHIDGKQGFKFSAYSGLGRPNNADGEADRMTWLGTWLHDNAICEKGYKIIERKEVYRGGPGAISPGQPNSPLTIYYTGVCE
jgi:hypothetical protein